MGWGFMRSMMNPLRCAKGSTHSYLDSGRFSMYGTVMMRRIGVLIWLLGLKSIPSTSEKTPAPA